MTDLDARTRRGAHRTRREPLRVLAPLLLVMLAAVLVAGFLLFQDSGSSDGVTAKVPGGTAAPPDATKNPTTSPKPSQTSKPTPTAKPSTTTSPTARREIEVVVLNGSSIAGLGRRAADAARDAGWTVLEVGNFSGEIASTTVYYPPGRQAEAALLAADLPGSDRVRERFGNLSTTRLTVIVREDYPR